MLFHKYIKDILLFSDIMEEPSLRDSSISTVKSDDVGSNPDEGKPVLESQLSKTEEKPVTYHADFEMPVFNIQVYIYTVFRRILWTWYSIYPFSNFVRSENCW